MNILVKYVNATGLGALLEIRRISLAIKMLFVLMSYLYRKVSVPFTPGLISERLMNLLFNWNRFWLEHC